MTNWPRICVVSASGQNVFFGEILEAFRNALSEQGCQVEESVDCFPPPEDDLVYLFVPHEYNPMVHELARPNATQLRRSIALCTEQPGTGWFETAAETASHAGAAVDINALGVRALRQRGIDAVHAPLGYTPCWDGWHRHSNAERPVDVAFLGAHTDRRARIVASCAPALAGHRAEIHMTETVHPHVSGTPHFLADRRKWELLARTKVMLNVHHGDLAYMEWHRVLGAALNGCVVLSEHSLGIDPFEPGVHFISTEAEHLPLVLEGLLADPAQLEQIRTAAYDLVREKMPMSIAAEAVLRSAERVVSEPMPTSSLTPPPSIPLPVEPPTRAPEWEARVNWLGEDLPMRAALKHLLDRTREIERRLERMTQGAGKEEEDTVEEFGPFDATPKVSVLLTVHNYADLVGEALRSVALNDLREIEVVAVDDASSDGSDAAVRATCECFPWLPLRLVRRSRNRGLAAARNLAVEHARAELLFILDADNAILPGGLDLLVQALERNPGAGFAYGILEAFDASGPKGLKSWLAWDPERLRYGSYIDAMAMIRRSALRAVGGYPTDRAFAGGWEDFAVWVAMADAGLRGIRVPDFVGRYRTSPHSMVSLTDVDHSESWAALLRRYPRALAFSPSSAERQT